MTNAEIKCDRVDGFVVSRRIALVLALAAGLMTSGCAVLLAGAAAGAGAAGVAYVRGDLRARVQADPQGIEKASLKAYEVMDIRKISSSSSALDAEIIGRTAADTKIAITAKADDAGGSSLSIRIGVFGDESMSRRIYDELKKQLPDAGAQ